jgi:hypothetical protein
VHSSGWSRSYLHAIMARLNSCPSRSLGAGFHSAAGEQQVPRLRLRFATAALGMTMFVGESSFYGVSGVPFGSRVAQIAKGRSFANCSSLGNCLAR